MNPYFELGVTPQTSLEEIKQAYRKSVLRYHPDSAFGKGNPDRLNKVLQAYQILKAQHEQNEKKPSSPNNTQVPASNHSDQAQIDKMTSIIPLHELINYLEQTNNRYVRMTAITAISLKNTYAALRYLNSLLHRVDPETQCFIIDSIGNTNLNQTSKILMPWIFSQNANVAISAIKTLEVNQLSNRNQIIETLQSEVSHWKKWFKPVKKTFEQLTSRKQMKNLGAILLREKRISKDQLEIALLLQKNHPLRLGALLNELGYITAPIIQNALLIQKQYA